jgi:hypothetical protein
MGSGKRFQIALSFPGERRWGAAIMPLRFDSTEIRGLFSTDGYVWLGDDRDPPEVAGLIIQRWQLNGGVLPSPPYPSAATPPKIDLT